MTTMKLSYSSDMLTNYLQAELIAPQKKFEALQASDGHALLFSISDKGVLFLTEETSGKTRTGWTQTDLSSALIAADFKGKAATVRTFEAAQSVADRTIGLAMAVSADTSDHLYVSLGNADADTGWTKKPNWAAYPFDADGTAPPKALRIARIFFAETTGSNQYIIVDILRDPSSAGKQVERYYIDPAKTKGAHWVKHDLPIDIEADAYQSCVGRIPHGYVDGVYTAGSVAGAGQLIYAPVLNVFGDGPPAPIRMSLPGDAVAGAIAAPRNPDLTSDLYAASGSTLYRFAADAQKDGATGVALVSHDVLAGTKVLKAMEHAGVTTLWGLNGSDAVFSLSAATADVANPKAWSVPAPLLTGVDAVSPYLNAKDGGNTIFAAGAGKLQRIIQATGTPARLWSAHPIHLPAPTSQKSLSFTSYTTTVQVSDANDLPMKGATLGIVANQPTPAFINGLYYTLGATPVQVAADATGSITVIQATPDLNGSVLSVTTGDGASTRINPMDKGFRKIAALNTRDKLKAATFIDADGKAQPLTPASASDKDLDAITSQMAQLSAAYDDAVSGGGKTLAGQSPTVAAVVQPAPGGVGGDIALAAGDLYSWLKTGVDAEISLVKDAATGLWRFIARIAGKVYAAALDSVEAVVGAVEWMFDQIRTTIKNLIRFIEFLFDWDDIQRTQKVLHTIVKRYMQDQVQELKSLKTWLDANIAKFEKLIGDFAHIEGWDGLGAPAQKPASGSAANPMKGQTSGSQLLAHHFQQHAGDITVQGAMPDTSLAKKLIDDLLTALKKEGHVLSEVYAKLKKLAHDFSELTVAQVLARLIGILGDGVLSSAQVVMDAVLDILIDLGSAVIEMLDAKIHIPVISDILNDIGVLDLSFLDLFTWIAAVAYTMVYKTAHGAAPFPDGKDADDVIGAQSWAALKKLVPSASHIGRAIFVAGHTSAGLMALLSDVTATFEAEAPTGENPFAVPSAIVGVVGGVSSGVADALAPRDPVDNELVAMLGKATTATMVISKILFSGVVQKKLGGYSAFQGMLPDDGRATGAIVNMVLVVPALVVTVYHFSELAEAAVGVEQAAAVTGEISNLASYVSRVAYTMAVNDVDEESKQVIIVIMAAANLGVAGLQVAEAAIVGASGVT